MFHENVSRNRGKPSAVRHRCENVSRKKFHSVDFGRLFRFRPFSVHRPPVFVVFLRFACVLWCVFFVLRLFLERLRLVSVRLDKIYSFSFFVRFRATKSSVLIFWLLSVRPSLLFEICPTPYITPSISKQNFFTLV